VEVKYADIFNKTFPIFLDNEGNDIMNPFGKFKCGLTSPLRKKLLFKTKIP